MRRWSEYEQTKIQSVCVGTGHGSQIEYDAMVEDGRVFFDWENDDYARMRDPKQWRTERSLTEPR